MARITDQGVQPDDLATYIADIEELLRTIFGQDLSLDAETPQGQFAATFGLFMAGADEVAVHATNGLNLYKAAGLQLDDIGTLFDLARSEGTRSSVTATLSGTPGTIVLPGARARTTTGALFFLTERRIIQAGGTVEGTFRSQETGPIVAGAGELTQLVDAISGWTGITNAAPAVLGRDRETDPNYRKRFQGEVSTNARDALEVIRSRVLTLANVTDCLVLDNSTNAPVTTQGVQIAARALLVLVEGGDNDDIATAIAATKPAGSVTIGDQLVQVARRNNHTVPIRFQRVTEIPLTVTVRYRPGPLFPSNGPAVMRNNLLQWFNGTWPTAGPGIFDQSGIAIGEAIDLNRLVTPLNAVPGHTIEGEVVVQRRDNTTLGTPDLDERYTLASEDITLTLLT